MALSGESQKASRNEAHLRSNGASQGEITKPLLRWAFPVLNWVSQCSFAPVGDRPEVARMWVRHAPCQTQRSQSPGAPMQKRLKAFRLQDSLHVFVIGASWTAVTGHMPAIRRGCWMVLCFNTAQCSLHCSQPSCHFSFRGSQNVMTSRAMFLRHIPSVVGSSLGQATGYSDLNCTVFFSFSENRNDGKVKSKAIPITGRGGL
jgi:hypothetical protein